MGKLTHFISVPATPTIKNGFTNFKELVLKDPEVSLDESLFQVPEKLHVTICIMNLESEEDRQRAVECLNHVKETVWRPIVERSGPIKLQMTGLGTFQRDRRHANVVFGNVLSADFASLADGICQAYVEKNLVSRKTLTSRYHLTVLNSSFIDKSVRRITNTFDASRLLHKYRSHSFGEMLVEDLHLSELGTKDETGYYGALEKVTL